MKQRKNTRGAVVAEYIVLAAVIAIPLSVGVYLGGLAQYAQFGKTQAAILDPVP